MAKDAIILDRFSERVRHGVTYAAGLSNAAITAKNSSNKSSETLETDEEYAERIFEDWAEGWAVSADLEKAGKGSSKAIIDALKNGTLTDAQILAMKTAAGL